MEYTNGAAGCSLCPARGIRHERVAAGGGLDPRNARSDQGQYAGDAQDPPVALCTRSLNKRPEKGVLRALAGPALRLAAVPLTKSATKSARSTATAIRAAFRLMPPCDRDLGGLRIEARDQIQMEARGFRLRGPAVHGVKHRRQRRRAQGGVGFRDG